MTSATPAAGKSFVSLNLGAALSRSATHRCILSTSTFAAARSRKNSEIGISDILSGTREGLEGVGRRIEEANLAIFPNLPVDEGSPNLLAGEAYANLVAGLRALPVEAVILCDLPPVFAGDDAMLSLELLDGYILVVDSGRTTARQVTQAIELLEPTPCLGTILNRYRGGIAERYGYGYAYGNESDRS